MSGCPWTLSLSLSVVRCRLLKKRDNDDLVGMQLDITHKLSSFLSVWSMAGLDMADHRGQVGVHRVEQIGDLAQAVVDCVQPGGHRLSLSLIGSPGSGGVRPRSTAARCWGCQPSATDSASSVRALRRRSTV